MEAWAHLDLERVELQKCENVKMLTCRLEVWKCGDATM